jgi:ABC-type phosphate transport system auxiliary subunit
LIECTETASTRSKQRAAKEANLNRPARQLTTADVARSAGTSESFIRQRANSGEIPCVVLSDRTRVFQPEAVGIAARLAAKRRPGAVE